MGNRNWLFFSVLPYIFVLSSAHQIAAICATVCVWCAKPSLCLYPFFYSQKSLKTGFSANSLTQTFALMYAGAGMEGATSHTGRRTFLTKLANQNTPIHLLKTLAEHKSISTTATYLYSNPTLLKAAVELA